MTKKTVKHYLLIMIDLEVIERPSAAKLALDPIKGRILAALTTPGSAASLTERVGLTRQKANYHLRALEAEGLVEPAGERRWGGITERIFAASAASYVVSPVALGSIASDPAKSADHLSASHLVALAARIVREVGQLWRSARRTDKRVSTISVDTVINLRSPAARAAFTRDLGDAITSLAARYHDDSPSARPHRLVVASYPAPVESTS